MEQAEEVILWGSLAVIFVAAVVRLKKSGAGASARASRHAYMRELNERMEQEEKDADPGMPR